LTKSFFEYKYLLKSFENLEMGKKTVSFLLWAAEISQLRAGRGLGGLESKK